jgi:hypothetical protein
MGPIQEGVWVPSASVLEGLRNLFPVGERKSFRVWIAFPKHEDASEFREGHGLPPVGDLTGSGEGGNVGRGPLLGLEDPKNLSTRVRLLKDRS